MGRKRISAKETSPEEFSKRIASIFESSNTTRKKISQETGLSETTQWYWEKETPKQLKEVWALADWAKVSRAWLAACYGPKTIEDANFISNVVEWIEKDPGMKDYLKGAIAGRFLEQAAEPNEPPASDTPRESSQSSARQLPVKDLLPEVARGAAPSTVEGPSPVSPKPPENQADTSSRSKGYGRRRPGKRQAALDHTLHEKRDRS